MEEARLWVSDSPKVKSGDIVRLLTSWVKKATDFILNYWKSIIDNWFVNAEFLKSLNLAGITPNNITTFRIFLLTIWILIYYLWNTTLWLSIITWSCVLDVVDWKLARKYNQKSKQWETFDAWIDKITDIVLTVMWTIDLARISSVLASMSWIIWVWKTAFHWKSQFKEWRPCTREQLKLLLKSAFQDEKTNYIGTPTKWAANSYWKYKTILQFTSSLWILWTSELSKLISMGIWDDILKIIFIATSSVSLILAHKSIKWKK